MARRQRVRQGARQARTGVWHGHILVGTLVKAADGGIGFSYSPAWLASEDAFPVASVLPLVQGAQRGDLVLAAFDNLLPDAEGELRAKITERVAAPDKDVFSLLSVLGRDCVGALQFLPQGEIPEAQDMAYRVISAAEMAADLRGLAMAPLAQGPDDDFRISIAGAQEKTAYLRIGDRCTKPRGITPTSHIFKTPMGTLPGPDQIDLSDSVENELFCMTLAQEIGLPAASVERITLPGISALAVERFDRRWNGAVLTRLPQEDLCQALGHPSTQKYQRSGGPGIRQIMELLRESDEPILDREAFLRAQMFFYLIGASDGHAKNFSLHLGRRGRFRLAPLYDVLSIAPVVQAGRLQRKRYRMAMSVDGHYRIDDIVPRHFENEARASGLPKGRALVLLAELVDRLGPALARAREAVQDQAPDFVMDAISQDAMARAETVRVLLAADPG